MPSEENNIDNNENNTINLEQKLTSVPLKPGVYQFKNSAGTIIYVGKAIRLRSRIRSYFQQGRPVDAKTKALIRKIADFEVIVTDSEAEALILEDILIKKLKPRYNILLRDDKSFPYVRVTNEEYPRVFPTRKIIKDGSKYFGPFTEVKNLKQVLRLIRQLFYIRSCDLKLTEESIKKGKFKICLDYHIDKCQGPCENIIPKYEYNENIKLAMQILNGKTRSVEKMLEQKMEHLSENLKFEEAATVRNHLQTLKDYSSKQKVVSSELIDKDVFALTRVNEDACSLIFKIREGKLIGKRHFIIKNAVDETDEKIMQRSIERWYLESEFIPSEIDLQLEPEELEYITTWLGKRKGKNITISIPKIGDRRKLINLAETNAKYVLKEYQLALEKREQVIPRPVLSLQRDLHFDKPPRRIECIDNSHIQGSELVSSLVVFEDGRPKKSDYRKFKNKTTGKNDDYAAMREVVFRRYKRINEELASPGNKPDEKATPFPDLLIIDGGKGQLSAAMQSLKELNLESAFKVIGLAKRLEEVFVPGESEPILLPKTSSSLKLLQQLRDEAHRFAITFHRHLRDKRTLQTELTEIKGVGEKTANKLLIDLGSVENIKNADIATLEKHTGKKAAKAIFDHFHSHE